MSNNQGSFIYRAPRILAILFLLFLALFSLDVFEFARTPGDIIIGLLMHNIPVFLLTGLLIIAWKHEIVGAVTFITAGLLYLGLNVYRTVNSDIPWYLGISWGFTLAGPALLIGILFLINWQRRKTIE